MKSSGVNNNDSESMLIRLLCDHLMTVEYLFLEFLIKLQNFRYFINNCKSKLKRLNILIDKDNPFRKDYLIHASNFQKIHNSLKIFGIKERYGSRFNWTDEEIGIINLLKNQGIDFILSDEFY
jgi:hypothetical protein